MGIISFTVTTFPLEIFMLDRDSYQLQMLVSAGFVKISCHVDIDIIIVFLLTICFSQGNVN